jgi:hypothetical protein
MQRQARLVKRFRPHTDVRTCGRANVRTCERANVRTCERAVPVQSGTCRTFTGGFWG